MKYVGIYWTLFAPMIKKSIRARFDSSLAERSIREGKREYRRLLSRADDLGPGNPMAMNAYFAYVFAAAWLGSGREITPDEMALVMTDVLESKLLRTVFGMTDLNRQPKKANGETEVVEAALHSLRADARGKLLERGVAGGIVIQRLHMELIDCAMAPLAAGTDLLLVTEELVKACEGGGEGVLTILHDECSFLNSGGSAVCVYNKSRQSERLSASCPV